ncbi:MAG: outer membrane beta-barrel protein [Anaeromyxobacter sp.]|nr:outer membrane beta-barrel protein [Anaeromyxobacter sp.]MBL0276577.1 outer membrane beta-barrel protein [Anaeromyxobacter sp.]
MLGSSAPALAGAGNGIRFGGSEGRLHPFLELEVRYDSNAYATEAGATVADVILHVRPGLQLSIPGETTAVDFKGALDWAQYLGMDDPGSKDLSNLFADAQLGIGINRNGTLGLELEDTFRRSNRPQALSFATGTISNYNLLALKAPWKPGGGALTLNVNGGWAMETYEAPLSGFVCADPNDDPATCTPVPASDVSKLGYNELRAGAGAAWKFLPRTSALFDFGYFKRMPNDTAVVTLDPGGYRVTAGVTGLVTPHLGATVKAGYGSTTGVTPTLGTFLATVEGEWIPSETASVKLGYGHDLGVDPGFQYTSNRVSLAARQLMAGRYTLAFSASYDNLAFQGGGSTDILRASPSLGIDVTRWLKLELAYAFTDRASSGAAASDYSKHEAWLKATCTY